MKTIHYGISAAALASLLALGACGDKEASTGNAQASAAISPSDGQAAQQGGPGGGQFDEIAKCLKAAGLEDKLPQRPSDMPSDMPSGAPEGGGMAAMQDPDVQKALKACGIELPQGPPRQQSN